MRIPVDKYVNALKRRRELEDFVCELFGVRRSELSIDLVFYCEAYPVLRGLGEYARDMGFHSFSFKDLICFAAPLYTPELRMFELMALEEGIPVDRSPELDYLEEVSHLLHYRLSGCTDYVFRNLRRLASFEREEFGLVFQGKTLPLPKGLVAAYAKIEAVPCYVIRRFLKDEKQRMRQDEERTYLHLIRMLSNAAAYRESNRPEYLAEVVKNLGAALSPFYCDLLEELEFKEFVREFEVNELDVQVVCDSFKLHIQRYMERASALVNRYLKIAGKR
jgi:hypothetical protein